MQIHWAARRGDNAAIDRQLARNIAVDVRDADGKTPLLYAAGGRLAGVATLEKLLAAGANPNAVEDSLGETALALATETGNIDKVQCLLAAGANPEFVNKNGYTAITHVTYWQTKNHLAVLERLLSAGCPTDTISCYGESALRTAVRVGNLAAIRLLIDHGASREPAEFSELMWAIALGDVADVKAQLQRKPSLSERNYWEMTPWLVSLQTGDIAKAEALLAAGATRDVVGRCGKLPLMYPIPADHSLLARWLLDLGMDPNAGDDFGTTPLFYAAQCGAAESLRVLLEAGASLISANGMTAIEHAANAEVAGQLVQAGADLNHVDGEGYWLLKRAAEIDDFEFAKDLLAMGAVVDTTSTGGTALHTAACWDRLDIVELLLDCGANANAVDIDGYTPLMFARSLECVDLLLRAGARLDIRDDSGADVFAHQDDSEIVDRLRSGC